MPLTINQYASELAARAGRPLQDHLLQQLGRAALIGEAAAKERATDSPRSRSGRLRNSIVGLSRKSEHGLDLVLSAGGGAKPVSYAAMQEYGGTAYGRPYLTIPLPAAKTGAGVVKGRYTVPGGLRSVPGLILIKSRAGNLLIVEKRGRKGKIVPLFVLKRSVTVQPHGFLRAGIDAARKALPEVLADALEVVAR